MRRSIAITIVFVTLILAASLVGPAGATTNGRILIMDGGTDIGSMRPDGTAYRTLLSGLNDAIAGTWSPNKTMFAYYHETDDGWELWVANADGSEAHRVASPYTADYTWSPDSRYMAYVDITRNDLMEQRTCFGIFIVNVRSLATREVTDGPDCRAASVDWSPAGDELLITDGYDSGERDLDRNIYKVDVISGEITQLTASPAMDRTPVWSPDGRLILFESSRASKHSGALRSTCSRFVELFTMRADGTRERRVSRDLRTPDCGGMWADDGRRIVWTEWLPQRDDETYMWPSVIKVMRRDGSTKTRLTHPRGRAQALFVSPNSRWVLYRRPRETENRGWYDLYKMRVDGSSRARLTRGGEHSGAADW